MKSYQFVLLSAFIFFIACTKDAPPEPGCDLNRDANTRFFEFEHISSATSFIVWTNQTNVLSLIDEQLALSPEQRKMHINGPIQRLPEECAAVNENWSWVHKPNEWTLADASIELCDGNPQYVEENLDEYIRIGRYCPWGSRVLREIEAPF